MSAISSLNSIEDAARWLLEQLGAEQRQQLRRLSQSELGAATHFGLGLFVRNQLFYAPESCLARLEAEEARRSGSWLVEPDGLSGRIIERAWEILGADGAPE